MGEGKDRLLKHLNKNQKYNGGMGHLMFLFTKFIFNDYCFIIRRQREAVNFKVNLSLELI